MFKKLVLVCLTLALSLSLAGAQDSFAAQKYDRKFLKMVSGTSGGSWYPIGAGIMKVVERETGISCSNGPGGGVGNMYAIQKGTADIALGYAHTITNAYEGRGKFKKPQNKLRFLAAMFPSTFQVAVTKKSKITSIGQLADKNVVPGKVGFTATVIAEQVLKAYGLSFSAIKKGGGTLSFVGFSDSAALMKDGHCDAIMLLSDCPTALLIDLNFSPGINLLGIRGEHMKKVLELEPGLIKTVIPKTAYKGMTEDVPTVGTATCLVIRDDVEDDVAYAITKAFWENLPELSKIKKKAFAKVKMENALRGAKIPVHPGAMKYYKEKGVTIK